jgi:hypothetical protein
VGEKGKKERTTKYVPVFAPQGQSVNGKKQKSWESREILGAETFAEPR